MFTSGPSQMTPAGAELRGWPCTDPAHLGLCSDDHIHADHIVATAASSRQRAADAAQRALRAYEDKHGDIDGPYADGFIADAMVEALEAEGWEFRG